MPTRILALAAVCALLAPARSQDPAPLLGQPAPGWSPVEWQLLPDGRTALEVADLRGKVVALLWLGADGEAWPLLRSLAAQFAEDECVGLVALHAIPGEAAATAVGDVLAAGPARLAIGRGDAALVVAAYRIPQTPWLVVIDADGIVRASAPLSPPTDARSLIDASRPPPANPLVGQRFGSTSALRRIGDPNAPENTQLTLYRWWTDGCAHCETSLPDLSRLHRDYRARGLHFVAVYHPKRLRPPDDDALRALLEQAGFAGELVADPEWRKLRELMRRAGLRAYTSVSFVVDREGIVQWVHPGPRLHRSDDPAYRDAAADFAALERFLAARLPAPGRRSPRERR
jgi:thiol-disulfide isomerase/thioredoxin